MVPAFSCPALCFTSCQSAASARPIHDCRRLLPPPYLPTLRRGVTRAYRRGIVFDGNYIMGHNHSVFQGSIGTWFLIPRVWVVCDAPSTAAGLYPCCFSAFCRHCRGFAEPA